jgi:hypothetical protein
MPKWRDEHPKYVHSMEWRDSLGIKHMLVFRDDDLDAVLREAKMIREFIRAARARDEKPAQAQQADSAYTEPEPDDDDYCPQHGRTKIRASQYGGVFCTARTQDGYCKFKSERAATR